MALNLPGRAAALILLIGACAADYGRRAPACPADGGPAPDWPNEPAGFQVIVDQPWNDPSGYGSSRRWESQWLGNGRIVRETDLPFSPPCALRIDYPTGFRGGHAPSTETIPLGSRRQVYVGIWWKASDPWEGHPSNSNKIQYLFTDSNGSMAMFMYGLPGGPYDLRVYPDWHGDWLKPNVNRTPITPGTWHRIEWLVAYGPVSDQPAGIVRFWLDGELIGDYGNVRLPEQPLTYYKVAPVWGGLESEKTQDDFYLYDHIRVSGR